MYGRLYGQTLFVHSHYKIKTSYMKEEIVETLKNALALVNAELETNGHPDNFDLEDLSYNLEEIIVNLDLIDEFEKFDE